MGPCQILRLVGKIAFELKLPNDLTSTHMVFHVFLLKECIGDPMLSLECLGLKEGLSYEEVLVNVLERLVKKFKKRNCFDECFGGIN